jgi:BirA family transcriptional regulator, biotin operon repressor / biotin---[acetyl-CoA-carboxylase] ligase
MPRGWIGGVIDYHERVGSTNDLALAAGEAGAPSGLLVLAEEQIAGRGRLDRRWHAPAGQCLLMSLLFRPGQPFALRAARITMLCGLALAEATAKVAAIEVQLKWPNDLIVAREDGAWRKIAGMLSEIGGAAQQPDLLVVGLGLNVNVPSAALAKLAPNAGSLRAEIGHPVDRVAILDDFLMRLEAAYARWASGWDPLRAWEARLAWIGQTVSVHTPDAIHTGAAVGVDAEGALLLRQFDGSRRAFPVGDVSLRPYN